MVFSIRDKNLTDARLLNNQGGQAIIEYVLILVVTVTLVLGGLYSLNGAFKSWANNYFGNYIACLLESGELPNIQGSGGDGGICNEIFKPFTLADGRPMNLDYQAPGGGGGGSSSGSREGGRAGSSVGGAGGRGGGGGGYGGGSFASGSFGQGGRNAPRRGSRRGTTSTFTGNMAASDYGSRSSGSTRRARVAVKTRLDNRFAFEEERERAQRRSVASTGKKVAEEGSRAKRIRVNPNDVKKAQKAEGDSGLSIPNLLKYLIIAGIIIALVVFLGGQGMQINKSMD